jgi:hypothetical protein
MATSFPVLHIEIATNISLIQNYLEIWNPFRDLLEGNRAVSSVNADTGR